jgi:hypothetical protein
MLIDQRGLRLCWKEPVFISFQHNRANEYDLPDLYLRLNE